MGNTTNTPNVEPSPACQFEDIGGGGPIYQALVRERSAVTALTDVYDVLHEIGHSGLCTVYRIRKKHSKIGGSARQENVGINGGQNNSRGKHSKHSFSFGCSSSSISNNSPLRTDNGRNRMRLPSSSRLRSRTASSSTDPQLISTAPAKETNPLAQETPQATPPPPPPSITKPMPLPVTFGVSRMTSVGSTTSFGSTTTEMYDFALKEINLTKIAPDKVEQLKREVSFLKALDHKNILKAYETFQEKNKLLIVMELLTGGDLHSRFPYTEQQVGNITRQILSAVRYMHDNHVIHRDLKLENILFESDHPNSLVKVIDFGLSAKYTQTHILKERVGTLYSMSPETMRGEYTSQADLWSIGVCAFMLLSNGQQPFEAKTPKQLVTKVLLAEYTFNDPVWENISDCAKDFIRALLVPRPDDRLTAAEARKHPWMVSGGQDAATVVDETLKQRVGESMVRYAGKSDFLRLALNVIAKKSTSAEIFELRSVFDQFDTKNNGVLDLSEFKAALSHLNCTDEDLESMFRKIDVNKSNAINYTEFLAAALETQGAIEEHRLAEAFDLLDTDDSGYISKENLREILGARADDSYLDQLIAQADFHKDGIISYSEFLQAFSQQRNELMMSIYDNHDSSPETSQREEDVLRSHGLLSGLRNAFNSGNSLLNMQHFRRKASSVLAS